MPITFEPVPEWLQDELMESVRVELSRLCIPQTLDGFTYHTYAIAQTVQDPRRTEYITKELYPEIAKQYDTTPSNVERAMRTAVHACWDRGGREELEKVARTRLEQRPTNTEFIKLVAAYIRRR